MGGSLLHPKPPPPVHLGAVEATMFSHHAFPSQPGAGMSYVRGPMSLFLKSLGMEWSGNVISNQSVQLRHEFQNLGALWPCFLSHMLEKMGLPKDLGT